jgi:hypothetical protein
MKLLIIFQLLLFSAVSFCQYERHEVIASSGGASNENGISVSWTMGESIINEFSCPGFMLSQGFQIGILSVVTESNNLPATINITAYPNPVISSLTIKIANSSESYNWSVNVFDYKGEVVSRHETKEAITDVGFSFLPPGAYLVQISSQGMYKTFHIIKQ